jgi:hypothetical protein
MSDGEADPKRGVYVVARRSAAWFAVGGAVLAVGMLVVLPKTVDPSARTVLFLGLPALGYAAARILWQDRCSRCKATLSRKASVCAGCKHPVLGAIGSDGELLQVNSGTSPWAQFTTRGDKEYVWDPRVQPARAKSKAARELLADEEIAAAIAEPREADLQRLLFAFRKRAKSAAMEAAIDDLIHDRRRHLDPTARPLLFTFLGCGLRIFGASDLDAEDGSHIGTLCFYLFGFPLLPIRSYLVFPQVPRHTPNTDALKGPFAIRGAVPMSFLGRGFRFTWVSAMLAVAVSVGVHFQSRKTCELWLLNGIDLIVEVEVDGHLQRLEPGQVRSVALKAGDYDLVVRHGAQVIDEAQLRVTSGSEAAYSVLDASTFVITQSAEPRERRKYQAFSWERETGEAVFAKPAEGKAGPTVDVLHGGYRATLSSLTAEGKAGDAAELATRISLVEPTEPEAVREAITRIAATRGVDAALAHARTLLESAPATIGAGNAILTSLIRLERRAQACALFTEIHAAKGTAQTAYLTARCANPEDRASLLATYGEDVDAHILLGRTSFAALDAKSAVNHFAQAAKLAPNRRVEFVSEYARALVSVRRMEEAIALVISVADSSSVDVELAALHARLVHRAESLGLKPDPAHPADYYATRLTGGVDQATYYAARVSNALPRDYTITEDARQVYAILVGGVSPLALSFAKDANPSVLAHLNDVTRILLAGELARTGDKDAAHRVLMSLGNGVDDVPALEHALTGDGRAIAMKELDPELQAALLIVQARRANSDEGWKAARESLEKVDILRDIKF